MLICSSMPTIANEASTDTRDRLLDVAERLFAEHGFDAVSLRAITTDAGANLAAVNYYFGSKEALIEAVVARLVEPLATSGGRPKLIISGKFMNCARCIIIHNG